MYLSVYVKSDYVQASVLFTVDYRPETNAKIMQPWAQMSQKYHRNCMIITDAIVERSVVSR